MSESGLKVALLSPCYWPETRRGSERFVHELAGGLLERGQQPRLITSHPGKPSRTVEDGLPIVRNWRPPQGRLQRRLLEDYMTHVPFSYLSLRRGDDDIAHSVFQTDTLAAARWRERTGRPVVFSYMGTPTRTGLTSKRKRIEITLKAIEGSDAVVALSRTVADAFVRWLGVDVRVIHPGVDLATFKPGPARAERPTIFCGAAIAEPRKRVALLIRAFRRVRKERPDARLVLSRPRDPSVAARLGIDDPGVELRDVDGRPELARTYAQAWVSALPSIGEAFGLVLVEAMACGTPGVGTDSDGIPEVIGDDSVGVLHPPDDEAGLAKALLEGLELAEDPGTPQRCRRRAEEFSAERTTEEYMALYQELLA